jgi:MYXO-CTERM domain-containing protein
VWHGLDFAAGSDTSLITPKLEVSESEDFVFTAQHAYSFETGPEEMGGADVYWDGAVIEYSEDDGKNWEDISELIDPGYGGTIGMTSTPSPNPLALRKGFVSVSEGYPKYSELKLDFGDKLKGKTVQLRFRIGTDSAAGADGWFIDDIEVSGVDNEPFTALVADPEGCDDTDTGETSSTGEETETGSNTDSEETGTETDSNTDETGSNTEDEGTESSENSTETDDDSDSSDDDDDDDDDGKGDGENDGCGCSTQSSNEASLMALLLGLPLVWRRRRARTQARRI